MLSIPPALQAQFEKCLRNTAIPEKMHRLYKKWLELRGIAGRCFWMNLKAFPMEFTPSFEFIGLIFIPKPASDREL